MSLSLKEFLYRNCKGKDGKVTHTSMGINAGAYYISKEMTNDFLDIYEKDVFEHGVPTHINEVPDPNRHSPFKVDFDFTYKMDNKYGEIDIDDIDPDSDGTLKNIKIQLHGNISLYLTMK